ncbi:DUF2946 family protein [Janthinobacterium fluminis]|uniref:DUF2946 family protein n=1 Tax=Janthinobacterium fluminis TaxID=2987524 RepID=A0ABT5K3Q9_9BURK|nr:DUF2946 family protein [Janthinobacterium fluminis]MDC8759620.1 DUF2946 family protein [Janthinobacterium fluminis]
MDELVKQAITKWPNVPHCYGWLGLDARGRWRMRDARAQALGLAGEVIVHAALLGFIVRNYEHDARGCWFFQNGPQRVYVQLEATPYIARSDPRHGFVLHTGAPLGALDEACLSPDGQLILRSGALVAQLDDRDTAEVLAALELDGAAAGDDALLAWLDGGAGALSLRHLGRAVTLQRIAGADVAARFGFERAPAPAADDPPAA